MGCKSWKVVERKIGKATKHGQQREVYYDGVPIPFDRVRREISRYGTSGLSLQEKYATVLGKSKFFISSPDLPLRPAQLTISFEQEVFQHLRSHPVPFSSVLLTQSINM